MDIYEQYFRLTKQMELLEDERDGLKKKIINQIKEEGRDKVHTHLGVFAVTQRKIWRYSEKINNFLQEVKAWKKIEEAKGIAECTVTEQLRFTKAK